jgi:glycosyltransferase involved in cell wall biosynthesis
MPKPLVSVVVPCYNLERYIEECLTGLCLQVADFPFEVIVCDDCSTDGSLKVIDRLRPGFPNLIVLENRQNLGLVRTMGRLFNECRGDYIAYVDGDDVALPGKLQALAKPLFDDNRVAITYHEVEVFNGDTNQVTSYYCRDYYNAKYIKPSAKPRDLLIYGIFLQASSVMFRKHNDLEMVLDHSCKIICDYPLHLGNAYLVKGEIQLVNQVLGRYRLHSNSFGAKTLKSIERRKQVTKDLLLAADHALRFGANAEDVVKSKIHSHFAAAYYYLKACEPVPFQSSIEAAEALSSSLDWYFDKRQRYFYESRHSFDALRERLMAGALHA